MSGKRYTPEELQKILRRHALWLEAEKGGRCADLRFDDLSGVDLSDVDLRGAKLRGADLSGANMSGADLDGVDLRDAGLRDAILRSTNLKGADLKGADLAGITLNIGVMDSFKSEVIISIIQELSKDNELPVLVTSIGTIEEEEEEAERDSGNVLLNLLEISQDNDVRMAAAEIMGASSHCRPEIVSGFLRSFRSESDPEVRARVAWALGQSRSQDPSVFITLREAAEDEDLDPIVRFEAERALEVLDGTVDKLRGSFIRFCMSKRKGMLALLEAFLEWPNETLAKRSFMDEEILKNKLRKHEVKSYISSGTISNYVLAFENICGRDIFTEDKRNDNISVFIPGIKEFLRLRILPILVECCLLPS
jgi:hypothetical protein